MKVETFAYIQGVGWSIEAFPALDSDKTLVIVFGAPCYLQETSLFDELANAYPNSHFIGGSTSGEILNDSILDNSLSVAIVKFEKSDVNTAHYKIENAEGSRIAGINIAEQLVKDNLKYIHIVSDGIKVNGTDLVEGIKSKVDPSVVVTGGLAGDGEQFQSTWILQDKKPTLGYVSAFAVYGDNLEIGYGSKGGWDFFGPQRMITKSQGNILLEIDGKPALSLYKEYLGELSKELPASALLFPLAIKETFDSKDYIVRTILGIDESTQSMIFAGDMPEGHSAQLMRANFDRIIDGAFSAAKTCKNNFDESISPSLCLAISCVGRRLVLKDRVEEEIEIAYKTLPENTHQIGYYSYGEICPSGFSQCDLHNQTMTMTLLREK